MEKNYWKTTYTPLAPGAGKAVLTDTTGYLMPGDPGAFDGHDKKEAPGYDAAFNKLKGIEPCRRDLLHHECKKCRGYGAWNLILDHHAPGSHFVGACSNCYGIGFVEERNKNHIHTWEEIENPRPFSPGQICTDCGELWDMELSLCKTYWPGLNS